MWLFFISRAITTGKEGLLDRNLSSVQLRNFIADEADKTEKHLCINNSMVSGTNNLGLKSELNLFITSFTLKTFSIQETNNSTSRRKYF